MTELQELPSTGGKRRWQVIKDGQLIATIIEIRQCRQMYAILSLTGKHLDYVEGEDGLAKATQAALKAMGVESNSQD